MNRSTHDSELVPTVFVVADDPSIYASLEAIARAGGWQSQLFTSAKEFLAQPRERRPACIALDVALLHLGGIDLREITAPRADMPLVFVAARRLDPDHMLATIREALERSCRMLAREAELRVLNDRFGSLTAREREVLALVVEGRLNKQVAWALGISELTVKVHRGQVMRKMQADSLADLIKMAGKLHLQQRPSDPLGWWPEAFFPGHDAARALMPGALVVSASASLAKA